jgi:hypothetical protein
LRPPGAQKQNVNEEDAYELAEALAAAQGMSLAFYLDWLVICEWFREPAVALALALEFCNR